MSPVKLRVARFQDYAAIAALEESNGLKSKAFAEWCGLWAGNPIYEELGPEWPIGWVLEDSEGRVVGCLCNLPLPYVFRGKKILVATGRAWAVDEKHRSFALLLMDAYFDQPKVDLFLNTTVNGNAAETFNVFGSLRVPSGDWTAAAFMVTNYVGFAASALRIKQMLLPSLLCYPVALALWCKDLFRKRLPRTSIVTEIATGFDERFDAFWEKLQARSSVLLAVRSRAVLNWHFAASRAQNQLWVVTVSQDGVMQAYGVFQQRDEPQYGLKRMRLVDFQALENGDDYCAAIIRRALEECRLHKIHVLEQVGCGLEKTRVFDQAAPYRRELPAWPFLYFTQDPQLAEALANPKAWAPSSFDGDASV